MSAYTSASVTKEKIARQYKTHLQEQHVYRTTRAAAERYEYAHSNLKTLRPQVPPLERNLSDLKRMVAIERENLDKIHGSNFRRFALSLGGLKLKAKWEKRVEDNGNVYRGHLNQLNEVENRKRGLDRQIAEAEQEMSNCQTALWRNQNAKGKLEDIHEEVFGGHQDWADLGLEKESILLAQLLHAEQNTNNGLSEVCEKQLALENVVKLLERVEKMLDLILKDLRIASDNSLSFDREERDYAWNKMERAEMASYSIPAVITQAQIIQGAGEYLQDIGDIKDKFQGPIADTTQRSKVMLEGGKAMKHRLIDQLTQVRNAQTAAMNENVEMEKMLGETKNELFELKTEMFQKVATDV